MPSTLAAMAACIRLWPVLDWICEGASLPAGTNWIVIMMGPGVATSQRTDNSKFNGTIHRVPVTELATPTRCRLREHELGTNDYKRLIEEFCASEGIDDVGAMLHRGFVDIDDVSMQVEYLHASQHCRVLADLGEIPVEHESKLREFMLEFNFGNGDADLPVLSVHPDTGHAVLAVHLPLAGVLANGGLMQAIERHVQPLLEWWNGVIGQIGEVHVEDMRPTALIEAYA
jgi:hypothetical protein